MTTDTKLVCACGREFKNQSGLTLHQKKCDDFQSQDDALVPNNGKVVLQTPLNTTDRNQLQKLIKSRSDTILKALEQELNGNVDVIKDSLLRDRGITIASAQLNELIKSITEQIEAEVEEHTKLEKERVEIEMDELEEEYSEKEREMKERHKKEWKEVGEEKRDKKRKLKDKLKSAEDRVTKEKAASLVAQKLEYQKQHAVAKQVEAEVEAASQQRLLLIKQSKGRLEHTIRDATNRALEELWLVDSREAASELIHKIPTVNEALDLCQSPEGIHNLFRRLDPTIAALPAPKIDESKIIDPQEDEKQDDDEDEEDEEDRDWEHDQVYEEDGTRRRRYRR